jgi:hypothetical protein
LPLLGITTMQQRLGRVCRVWLHPGVERAIPVAATDRGGVLVAPSRCRLSPASIAALVAVVASLPTDAADTATTATAGVEEEVDAHPVPTRGDPIAATAPAAAVDLAPGTAQRASTGAAATARPAYRAPAGLAGAVRAGTGGGAPRHPAALPATDPAARSRSAGGPA